jgi:hypothetical protein
VAVSSAAGLAAEPLHIYDKPFDFRWNGWFAAPITVRHQTVTTPTRNGNSCALVLRANDRINELMPAGGLLGYLVG